MTCHPRRVIASSGRSGESSSNALVSQSRSKSIMPYIPHQRGAFDQSGGFSSLLPFEALHRPGPTQQEMPPSSPHEVNAISTDEEAEQHAVRERAERKGKTAEAERGKRSGQKAERERMREERATQLAIRRQDWRIG